VVKSELGILSKGKLRGNTKCLKKQPKVKSG